MCSGEASRLQATVNLDCPWDLPEFLRRAPPVLRSYASPLMALRNGYGVAAAHALCGSAFAALYFVFRERSKVFARAGLAAGMTAGSMLGRAQQFGGATIMSPL